MTTLRDRLAAIVAELPAGASVTLPADAVREWLDEESPDCGPALVRPPEAAAASWRERVWSCPAETRLTAAEAAEALGRPVSWIYRRSMTATPREIERAHRRGGRLPDRIPCRRAGGQLVILAGELREWIREHEEIVVPGRAGPRAA